MSSLAETTSSSLSGASELTTALNAALESLRKLDFPGALRGLTRANELLEADLEAGCSARRLSEEVAQRGAAAVGAIAAVAFERSLDTGWDDSTGVMRPRT